MPTVPDAILNNLRCIKCDYWLSCGPIRLLVNGGSICGRCSVAGPNDQYRHFAFEALACYFKFPCKYWENHCSELISFKKVPEHERKCKYGSSCSMFWSHPSACCKSRRRLNLKAGVKLEMMPDEVLEYLRCSNCAGYLSCAPVLVCRDGTSICHRCSSQIPQPTSEFIQDLCFETFADMMMFPCIFRYRGCTQIFKFGEEMAEHEYDCPYGQTYVRETHQTRQETPERNHRDPAERNHKEKGVIKTIVGHIYATLTPNAPFFTPTGGSSKNHGIFLDEFQMHRDNLSSKWGQDTYMQERPPDIQDTNLDGLTQISPERYSNPMRHSHLIDELKVRQKMRDSIKQHSAESQAYYSSQNESQNMKYSVYPTNS